MSIVIPAYNEVVALPLLLGDLRTLRSGTEIIVADGGSSDGTRQAALDAGASVVTSGLGRGLQLRTGAARARAPILGFLHADVRLNDTAIGALEQLLASTVAETSAWAFKLTIGSPRWRYRVIEFGANLRSSWLGLPYGDQGLFLTRALYDHVGGFPDIPLMEDVSIVRAIAAQGTLALLPAAVQVSPRRWERDGAWRRSAKNLMLLARWYGGASPEALAADYPRNDSGL